MKVTRAEFARLEGVNKATITRWVQAGRITVDAQGLIDPDEGHRQRLASESPLPHHQARKAQFDEVRQYPDTTRAEIAQPGATSHATDGRKPADIYMERKAEKIAIEIDKMAGVLVERAEVDYVLADFGNTLRGLLEGLPDRMAHECLRIREAGEMHKYLADTMADALVEVAEHMKRKMEEVK